MSSTVTDPAESSQVPRAPSDHLLWVVRSEWTKLWSLRSTGWTLLTAFVLSVGSSAVVSWALVTERQNQPSNLSGPLDVTGASLSGLLVGQLPIAVLGVLVISGEYSTGSIRTTLVAVPARLRLLMAKGVVLTVVAFVTGILICFPSFFLGMAFFNAQHQGVGLGEPHVLRAVIGGALLLSGSALLGYAIGILVRHTAGAVAVTLGLLFVVPVLLASIPADPLQTANKYFLASAAGQITSVLPQSDMLAAWPGYLLFLAEVAVLLVAGAALMQRRDA